MRADCFAKKGRKNNFLYMPHKIGLVGLPNVGKSSLFQFLTQKKDVVIENYPFATIDPNVGVMPLPDPRLEKLSEY